MPVSPFRGPHDVGRIVARNEAVKNARGLGMRVPGLRALRRDFRRLVPEIDRQLRVELKTAATPIRDRARDLAPHRTGRLRRSLRVSVQQRGVAITSRLPYANVQHWGGTTGPGHRPSAPWSGSIFVEPSLFISQALEEREAEVIGAMGDAVERAAIRSGWRRF